MIFFRKDNGEKMKIISNDTLLLDELFNDLKHEHIHATKETKELNSEMSVGTTIALVLSILLKKEKLEKYHSPWSEDKVINHLFWENLLIRDVDKHFVWRSQEVRKIGQEVLSC